MCLADSDWQNIGRIEGGKGSLSDDAIVYMAGKVDQSLRELPSTLRVAPSSTGFSRIDDSSMETIMDEMMSYGEHKGIMFSEIPETHPSYVIRFLAFVDSKARQMPTRERRYANPAKKLDPCPGGRKQFTRSNAFIKYINML